jgi:hypothetical protein
MCPARLPRKSGRFAIDFFDELSVRGTAERSAEALLHDAVAIGDTIAIRLFC